MNQIPLATIRNCIFLIVIGFLLSACDEAHIHSTDHSTRITSLEVVDAQGHSTRDQHYEKLKIDPFYDNGYFEVFWDTNTHDDYHATLYINDYDTLVGAIELEGAYCGPNEVCDRQGFMYCNYKSENHGFSSAYDGVQCSASRHKSSMKNVTELFKRHPTTLYLLLEVCDSYSHGCSIKSQRAVFQ